MPSISTSSTKNWYRKESNILTYSPTNDNKRVEVFYENQPADLNQARFCEAFG
jgi:hypothetical protein